MMVSEYRHLSGESEPWTLAELLREVRGCTVGEGLHNFGVVTDAVTRVGEVALRITHGTFSFKTACWLDQGGHLAE